ncbi:MAG: hypothetical protein ACKOI2_07270 [Actinomycetota bacterium]
MKSLDRSGLESTVRRCRHSVVVGAVFGWVVVYLALVATGQRFDTRYLDFGWQLIPWDVLSSDPFSSVWYLHIQPPLWNLILGVSAWISPFGDAITLQSVMFAFGVLAVASSAVLARNLGLSRRTSVIVALAATIHPEALKGAFEPTYELPVAALLVTVLAVVSGLGGSEHRVHRRLILLSVLVTVVSMTRSLYHPIWALIVVGSALWFLRSHITRRTVLVTVLIPVIVMGGWMLKNQMLFGQANLSSWFGMNLQRAVVPVLDLKDLKSMRERGEVSDIAMIGPFGKYELYEDVVEPCEPSRSHRALSEPMRTTDQWSPNFNYECYLPIFEQAGRDAWAVIKEHPDVWLEGRLWSLRSTASVAITPAESSSAVMRGLDQIYSLARIDYRGVLSTRGWGTPIYGQLTAPVDFGLILIPLYGLVAIAGLWSMLGVIRRRPLSSSAQVYLIGSSTVVFTVLIGAIAELGEQARFRTMTDPLAVVIAAGVIGAVIRRRRDSSAGTSSPDPA